MVKTIKVSDDAGATYSTLPGNQGEFSDDAGQLDDTVFGQNFRSGQPNLVNWSVSTNAIYKGFAGYQASIKQTDTSTAMTGEALANTSGQEYGITNPLKTIIDRNTVFTVYDGATDVTDEVESIDYLFGRIKFKSSYTVVGSVTMDGNYWTTVTLAKYRNFTLGMTQESIDNTDIPSAQGNSGHMTFDYGLKTVSMEASGVYAVANGYRNALIARSEVIIEINPDGGGKSTARGFFKATSRRQSGNIGALEEENTSFTLFVPADDLLVTPFRWRFTSTDLSPAVVKAIEAWQDETALKVDYSPDGSEGLRGDVIVSDISLTGGLEAMNEFSVNLQGNGQVTAY